MMLLPCPHCGPRNVTEFAYGGDAHVRRPADPARASDAEWEAYLYLRDNPRGAHDELWQHTGGCRRWIAVRRDTLTHEVLAAAEPGKLP
jgi:heterotetrameric sarcosine oxidase delta subunit